MAVWPKHIFIGCILGVWVIRRWPGDIAASGLHNLAFPLAGLYASCVFILMGVLGMLRVGNNILGKDKISGQIPAWSYVVFWPFHLINHVLVRLRYFRETSRGNPPAHEVLKNLWVGNIFAQEVATAKSFKWQAIVDLTCEFPARMPCKEYLNLPLHDGNPPTLTQFLHAIEFVKVGHMKEAN
mmetsp:Transcript_18633/g.25948  ORF Transcript_18633/g.25948 Transcript_18633/m.25948 type:complete len:183 (+) Transcript_18633:208-756(+)